MKIAGACFYFFSFLGAATLAPLARAGAIAIPTEAVQAMDRIYGGDPESAISIARNLEQEEPDHPLGYLLEAEADWWKTYCAACEVKYGMIDAWRQSKQPEDGAYLALADQVIRLAQMRLAKSETAEMHVYVGMGAGLKARLYALRGENHNVARSGVASRAEMLRALQLDPQMADAIAGLGFYNYYVDTLSSAVKILRFLMGIPGGSKEEGIRQMEIGMNQGVLLAADSRFYLSKNLRTFDLRYERALAVAEPLATRYPRNRNFLLLLGNLNQELGRREAASRYFQQVLDLGGTDSTCAIHLQDLANTFLSSIH
jgi:tetratricopeptide (TPR) repeat protein